MNKVIIGCVTVRMGLWNPASIVPGSVVRQCKTCGADVYLAPSSQNKILENPETVLSCMCCLKKWSIEAIANGEDINFKGVLQD